MSHFKMTFVRAALLPLLLIYSQGILAALNFWDITKDNYEDQAAVVEACNTFSSPPLYDYGVDTYELGSYSCFEKVNYVTGTSVYYRIGEYSVAYAYNRFRVKDCSSQLGGQKTLSVSFTDGTDMPAGLAYDGCYYSFDGNNYECYVDLNSLNPQQIFCETTYTGTGANSTSTDVISTTTTTSSPPVPTTTTSLGGGTSTTTTPPAVTTNPDTSTTIKNTSTTTTSAPLTTNIDNSSANTTIVKDGGVTTTSTTNEYVTNNIDGSTSITETTVTTINSGDTKTTVIEGSTYTTQIIPSTVIGTETTVKTTEIDSNGFVVSDEVTTGTSGITQDDSITTDLTQVTVDTDGILTGIQSILSDEGIDGATAPQPLFDGSIDALLSQSGIAKSDGSEVFDGLAGQLSGIKERIGMNLTSGSCSVPFNSIGFHGRSISTNLDFCVLGDVFETVGIFLLMTTYLLAGLLLLKV